MGRLSWIIQMGPKCYWMYPYMMEAEREREYTNTETESQMKTRQRDIWRCWPWRLESCGHKPRKSSSYRKLKEARSGFSPRAFRKAHRCRNLGSLVLIPARLLTFWTVREVISVILSHWVCGDCHCNCQPWYVGEFSDWSRTLARV